MQTAEQTLSMFIKKFSTEIVERCLSEGFTFKAKETEKSVAVKCVLPNRRIRFIIFDDHRKENSHSEKPHVCNQWYKGLGQPLSFTTGKEITDKQKLSRILIACAIMCITQTETYTEIKEVIFS